MNADPPAEASERTHADPVLTRSWAWAPAWAHMMLIFASSSLPGAAIPSAMSAIPDTLVHGLVYGLLGALMLRALIRARWSGIQARPAWMAVALTIGYGGFDEWHQAYVPGRMPEVGDLTVDALAAVAVVGALWAWSIIRASRAPAARRAGHAAPASTERFR